MITPSAVYQTTIMLMACNFINDAIAILFVVSTLTIGFPIGLALIHAFHLDASDEKA